MEKDIKKIVRDKYTQIVESKQPAGCCDPSASCCDSSVETAFNESYRHLDGYHPDADLNLGCGLPTEYAGIRKGDTVLDLGAGAGNDVFVARSLTGEEGRVIGVDMTEAMIARAEQNRRKLGFDNVEFLLGEIEDLPLPDNSVDVAISNCVMNLVPDKRRAYAEVYRVLRPGGHFSISDIVTIGELTPDIREAAALYAGCVSGALQKENYLAAIAGAGFKNIRIDRERRIELPDELLLRHIEAKELRAFRESGSSIYSINVYGEKGREGSKNGEN